MHTLVEREEDQMHIFDLNICQTEKHTAVSVENIEMKKEVHKKNKIMIKNIVILICHTINGWTLNRILLFISNNCYYKK